MKHALRFAAMILAALIVPVLAAQEKVIAVSPFANGGTVKSDDYIGFQMEEFASGAVLWQNPDLGGKDVYCSGNDLYYYRGPLQCVFPDSGSIRWTSPFSGTNLFREGKRLFSNGGWLDLSVMDE